MKYVFYVAGMPFDGNTIKEGKSLGGSESAAFYLAKELAKRGNNVFVFSNIPDGKQKNIDGVNYLPIGSVTAKSPFGENFTQFAEVVPHDVLIAQRIPSFFHRQYNSKINLWWSHDLAQLQTKQPYDQQLWNVQRVLAVSEFHKKQIHSVYGHKEDTISILPNSIDMDIFSGDIDPNRKLMSKTMIYSSRPERGLQNLVSPDGIMEKLYKIDPEIKLIVCGYDNTTQKMEAGYKMLWGRCDQLPNVENYGALSKENLANLMKGAWAHIYPTDFEETSCITAMEEQASGTPFITTKTAALSETLKDGGVVWVDKKDGVVDIDAFVKAVVKISSTPDHWLRLHKKSLDKSKSYSVDNSANHLESIVKDIFEDSSADKKRLVNHYLKNSDVIAAKKICDEASESELLSDEKEFIKNNYRSLFDNYSEFYESVADYNINEIHNTHNIGNHESHYRMPRLQPILNWLSSQEAGSEILDYGCCIGQHTFAFAAAFPKLKFVGCDISKSQIEIAEKYKKENNIDNVEFLCVNSPSEINRQFDGAMCSEVLEHVIDYVKFLTELESRVKTGKQIIVTTPYGPHERVRWNSQQTREHLHHFEEMDLQEIFKNKKDFTSVFIASEKDKFNEVLGNYAYSWSADSTDFYEIDYKRKAEVQSPKYTLSVCMICKPDGLSLAKTLDSIKSISNEIIIGIDGKKDVGRAWEIAKDYNAIAFELEESPTKVGFDKSRNKTIEKSSCDWIMWIDDDEDFIWPEKLYKYLCNNTYDSYAIHQHHYSAEPAGLLKTDLPCRVFRNNIGIKFYGMVHEHPEIDINGGCGETALLDHREVAICHNGYDSEETRRQRFIRNWPLMAEDYKRNPNRELGKFLFMRDLTHLNRFDWEKNGNQISPDMEKRCLMALDIFRNIVKLNKSRLIIDSMPYVTEATKMLTRDGGYDFKFSIALGFMGMGDDLNNPNSCETIQACLPSKEDAKLVVDTLFSEKFKQFENIKYI